MTFRLLTLLAFSASASAADLLPFLRLPRLAQAPTIDGRLASGEWDHAAATAGFSCFDLGWALAPPWLQTTVWLGWDESNLYLAMRAPYGGAPLQARTFQDDSDTIFLDDHLEWQILPSADRTLARRDDGGFFKFMVNPHGAVLDQRMEGAKPVISSTWAAHAEVRSAMQDGAWVIEMRVPVAALGNSDQDLAHPTDDAGQPIDNECEVVPAETSGVIGTMALGNASQKAGYSNYGSGAADVAAPGGTSNSEAPSCSIPAWRPRRARRQR